jgi:hypothetical protein
LKSGRQKREELDARRKERREAPVRAAKLAAEGRRREQLEERLRLGEVLVNPSALSPRSSYSQTGFERRGTYAPVSFVCQDCGKPEVWTPHQQKWWYEIAKGDKNTVASRCRPCRAVERRRKDEARRVHLEGLARKRGEQGG